MVETTYMRVFFFFFSSRRRHTRYWRDWSSDVCSSDLFWIVPAVVVVLALVGLGVVAYGVVGAFTRLGREAAALDREMRPVLRSGERRVGEEGRSRGAPYH